MINGHNLICGNRYVFKSKPTLYDSSEISIKIAKLRSARLMHVIMYLYTFMKIEENDWTWKKKKGRYKCKFLAYLDEKFLNVHGKCTRFSFFFLYRVNKKLPLSRDTNHPFNVKHMYRHGTRESTLLWISSARREISEKHWDIPRPAGWHTKQTSDLYTSWCDTAVLQVDSTSDWIQGSVFSRYESLWCFLRSTKSASRAVLMGLGRSAELRGAQAFFIQGQSAHCWAVGRLLTSSTSMERTRSLASEEMPAKYSSGKQKSLRTMLEQVSSWLSSRKGETPLSST